MKTETATPKEITPEQYNDLKNPVFISQTALDDDFMYWVIVESEGVRYKVHMSLF